MSPLTLRSFLAPAVGGLALTAIAVLAASPASGASLSLNPMAPTAGFTVVGFGDVTLANTEIEGSVAAGGTLATPNGYAFIHTSGLTPPGYTLPVVDGDPTRVLVGGTFDPATSGGVAEVSSRGALNAAQLGFLKIGDTSSLAINPRGNQGAGDWVSASGTPAGTQPAIYVPDTTAQPKNSIASPTGFTSTFANAESTLATTGDQLTTLQSCVAAHATALTPGPDAGTADVPLVAGTTNVVTAGIEQLQVSRIEFTGATPGAATPVVFNITGTGTTVTLPAFTAASSSSAANPNPIAPFVLWNLTQLPQTITVTGQKISGSLLAPHHNLTLDIGSVFEGQVVAHTIHTTGGEVHHYAFTASIPCLDTTGTTGPVVTPTPTPTSPVPTPAPTTPVPTPTPTPTPTTPSAPSAPVSTQVTPSAVASSTPAATDGGTSQLAHTGSDISPAAASIGGLLLAGGIALTLILRRRAARRS
jgi:choice-of-anchor A domain-containing protein/LPXTG-motif cell wall-anchored protein